MTGSSACTGESLVPPVIDPALILNSFREEIKSTDPFENLLRELRILKWTRQLLVSLQCLIDK